jgi:hypothetical protein
LLVRMRCQKRKTDLQLRKLASPALGCIIAAAR